MIGRQLAGSAAASHTWNRIPPPPPNSSAQPPQSSGTGYTPSSPRSQGSRSSQPHQEPYETRDGRRYLRDVPYPLPSDLVELNRQTIQTLLVQKALGSTICSPNVLRCPPRRVLEVGCGSALWTSLCHDFFAARGHPNISFTGIDIVALAPDLRAHGINWHFVKHDLRRTPWPFEDATFDLVMLKDISFIFPQGTGQVLLDEPARLLRPGGTLEIWTSDHVIRSLHPHPGPPPQTTAEELAHAARTATYLIAPGTPMSKVANPHLLEANSWMTEALNARRFPLAPCSRIASYLYQEVDSFAEIGSRRVAIPFSALPWEEEENERPASGKGKARATKEEPKSILSPDQAALRHAALMSHLGLIESLEGILREASGMSVVEWNAWWSSMMSSLLDEEASQKGLLSGECLEIGAWWATKIGEG